METLLTKWPVRMKQWTRNLITGMITFSYFIGKKMKHRYQSSTRIGRQFQSLERQVYADWTSVSFPFCQRSCLIWRIMTNTMTNTYVVIFLSVSIFGRGYDSRYQNFEFTGMKLAILIYWVQCAYHVAINGGFHEVWWRMIAIPFTYNLGRWLRGPGYGWLFLSCYGSLKSCYALSNERALF